MIYNQSRCFTIVTDFSLTFLRTDLSKTVFFIFNEGYHRNASCALNCISTLYNGVAENISFFLECTIVSHCRLMLLMHVIHASIFYCGENYEPVTIELNSHKNDS